MITLEQYFGSKPYSRMEESRAVDLLERVNMLIDHAVSEGAFTRQIDPDTGSEISGSKGGSGDGGFRTQDSKTGAPGSAHKLAMAVDVYDPNGELDNWITDKILTVYGLYREHPSATVGWCHLGTKAPRSGKRTFLP